MKTKNDVTKIICEVFEIPDDILSDNLSPENLEKWDSLAQLNLITAIENEFEVTLDYEEIFSIYNLGDIYSLLEKRGLI